jgi:hypothetical protein
MEKDNKELENEKKRIIDSLKQIKKDEIIPTKEELSLWKRIKRVLMGS